MVSCHPETLAEVYLRAGGLAYVAILLSTS